MRTAASVALLVAVAAAVPAARLPQGDLQMTLGRVGARVVEWYSRAQSIVSDETVWIQALRADMSPAELPRRLGFELRVSWDPETAGRGGLPDATILRQLLTVNGRPPGPRDEPGCMDPKGVSPEPLSMLLPEEREAYSFHDAGPARVGGRDAVMLDYKAVARQTPEVTWSGECVSVSLPGWTAGRVWVDAETYDVLRLDERLVGQFEFDVPRDRQLRGAPRSMLIERADSSVRYRRVVFTDPPDVLMLPDEIDTVTIVRGGGIQRNRIRQRYTSHRRFLGDARVVP